jgi:hypothetical protein
LASRRTSVLFSPKHWLFICFIPIPLKSN